MWKKQKIKYLKLDLSNLWLVTDCESEFMEKKFKKYLQNTTSKR